MKGYRTLLGVILTLALLAIPVAAQDSVDKVILASSVNNPDAMVASSVSQKLGVPILFTEKDQLSDDTASTLEDLSPEEVVVVGGPAVVSESVVQGLKDRNYSVTWLWGMTRYGTAEEITTRFWPEGSDEAFLVENNIGEQKMNVLAASTNLAGDSPILPIPEGKIPAGILNQLKEMDVETVTIIGTNVTDEMELDLDDLGVKIQERIQEQDEEELEERIENETAESLEGNETLMVVASSAANQAVSSVNVPGSKSLLVSSEDEISGIVQTVNDRGVEEVKVVGRPTLAQTIANTLRNQTDAEVELVSGQGVSAQAANIARNNRPSFARKFKQKHARWQQRLQKAHRRMKKKARKIKQRIGTLIDDYNSSEARQMIRKAKQSFQQGNYQEALEKAREAKHQVREQKWERIRNNWTAVHEEVEDEVEDLREKTQEMSEINREFGQEMSENMTVEERLETIEDFRERKREKIEQVVEQAREMKRERNERVEDWLDRAGKKSEEEMENCEEDIEEAQESAEGKVCTQQTQRLNCPHDGKTYLARNGCEISYLKSQGWEATNRTGKTDMEGTNTEGRETEGEETP